MITYNFVFALSLFIYMSLYVLLNRQVTNKWFILFYIYFTLVISVTLFPMPFSGNDPDFVVKIDNYIPFKNIKYILENYTIMNIFKNIVGNIIMFMPFGFIYNILSYKKTKFLRITTYCMLFSLFIESMQFYICNIIKVNYRVVDIDDIILNTLGGVIGYFMYLIYKKTIKNVILKKRKKPKNIGVELENA